jgi:citrate/tricarballylate utilization protein
MDDINLVEMAKANPNDRPNNGPNNGRAHDQKAHDQRAHEETARIMQICNACRYCEGFCAVFPAVTQSREFDVADTAYLANLCHHCGACYYACQYAPPHEFGVNVPATLAERRAETYADYAWPRPLGQLFARNGLVVSMAIAAGLALTLGLMLAMIAPHLFWGVHLGEGAFYQVMPHNVMAGIPLIITAFTLLAMGIGASRFWRDVGAGWPGWQGLAQAISAAGSLKYLDGDNAGDGPGCPVGDDSNSHHRRYAHHLTFYGFMLCFAATSTGTIYHYVFGWQAPYGYFSLPVILGTIGGVMLCWGTAWLWQLKRAMAEEMKSLRHLGMDYAFIWLLFWVSATGLALLALRETGFMGLMLAIHLALVYVLFLVLPYSKFVHSLYRSIALILYSVKR